MYMPNRKYLIASYEKNNFFCREVVSELIFLFLRDWLLSVAAALQRPKKSLPELAMFFEERSDDVAAVDIVVVVVVVEDDEVLTASMIFSLDRQ